MIDTTFTLQKKVAIVCLVPTFGSRSGCKGASRTYQWTPAPRSLDHKYVTEDVPCGLVPMAARGRSDVLACRAEAPLVLVTHGSVVSDLTGLNISMGAFVVFRRVADGRHEVAGRLYVE